MPNIVNVVTHPDHTLTVELSNHHKIVYDMRPRLQSIRFCALADMELFQTVKVEHHNTLVWDNGCQITIDEIISMVER